VLAHSSHVRGAGTDVDGVERPRARARATVTLAWLGREDEGVLVVPHAGERLYRLRS
jgi:hypothetical protein